MLPSLGALIESHARYARRYDLSRAHDPERIADALREAAELAGGREDEEPLALLYALTARGRALGAAWEGLPLLIASNMARAGGLVLPLNREDRELLDLRLRIAARSASFEDLRAFVAGRSRPIP